MKNDEEVNEINTNGAVCFEDDQFVPFSISKISYERIQKLENRVDTTALYIKYCVLAYKGHQKWIWATTGYMATALNISEVRVRKAKKELISLGLVKDVVVKDEKSTQIVQHRIQVNYLGMSIKTHPVENPQGGNPSPKNSNTISEGRNVVSSNSTLNKKSVPATETHPINNDNYLAILQENEQLKKQNSQLFSKLEEFQPKQLELFQPDELVQPKHFETFYNLYPRKAAKGKALLAWGNLCNQKSKANIRPSWKSVRKALQMQKKTELWMKLPEVIPYPASWINSNGWLNEPDEMKLFKPTNKEVPKKGFGFVGKPLEYSEAIKM